MDISIFHVDFNEMIDERTVLLSKNDMKRDISHVWVSLYEGMLVRVVMEDVDENGEPDDLVAEGVVMKNNFSDWSAHVKWCCRINDFGIRYRSEIQGSSA